MISILRLGTDSLCFQVAMMLLVTPGSFDILSGTFLANFNYALIRRSYRLYKLHQVTLGCFSWRAPAGGLLKPHERLSDLALR